MQSTLTHALIYTSEPVLFYSKVPALSGSKVILLDPMLGTGGSAKTAIRVLVEKGVEIMTMLMMMILFTNIIYILKVVDYSSSRNSIIIVVVVIVITTIIMIITIIINNNFNNFNNKIPTYAQMLHAQMLPCILKCNAPKYAFIQCTCPNIMYIVISNTIVYMT